MTQEILATKALLTLGVSTATTVGGAVSLSTQLNTLYPFLYLALPLWVFFLMVVVVCFIGAIGAVLADVMEGSLSVAKKTSLAFGTGLVSAFVVLPSLVEAPSMSTMLLTGLGMSFSGTILVFILAQVLKDKTLQTAIKNSISKSILYIFSKTEKFLDFIIGTGEKK